MTTKYEELISKLPEIAKVVNEFNSPEAQQRAFDLLAASLGVSAPTPTAPGTDTNQRNDKPKGKGSPKKPKSSVSGPKMLGELVLSPTGKKSFKEFAAEKKPGSSAEKSLVAVYYLEQILEVKGITADHVYTAYRTVGWRPPANPRNQLQVVKSRKAWIETADMDDIKTTHLGRTYVEHDLPKAEATQ